MIDINYELYKVFYHVASTLNFSEASKRLFISQSAVSQSIKTLERKLDQRRWQYKTRAKPHKISAGLRKSRTEFSSAESSVSHFTFCLATFTRGFALTSL